MADHYRAAADMIARWVLSDSNHCNVEVAEWFPSQAERQLLLAMLYLAKPKLLEQGKLKKNGSMAKLAVGRRRRFA